MSSANGTDTLIPLLKPRSIAVVGVQGGPFDPSARSTMGRRFIENLLRHGYAGDIYPINPRYETVGELRCYPSVAAVPGPVDAALLIVPTRKMIETLHDCGAKGVKAVTVITSGYAEAGAEGKAAEEALVRVARSYGMRLVGPNCLGYYNSHGNVALFGSASLLTRELVRGPIGFVTQSGALAASIVDRAQERGIGFSSLITTGNQADVHNVECLEYLVEDADTRVIALFAEAIGHTDRFRAAVRRAAELGKPCVVLKSGASEVAREAALTHTGSLVGDDAVYDAAFRQDGVVRVDEPDELFLTAALLANTCTSATSPQPGTAPRGAACIAVVSMSGAMGGIIADGAARHGVEVARLGTATQEALLAIPGVSGSLNPLDAAMATWAADFDVVGRIAGILASDPDVDVLMLAISGLPYAQRLLEDCIASVRAAGKVFVPMWAGDHADMGDASARFGAQGVTVFNTPGTALRAIRGLRTVREHRAALYAAQTSAETSRTGALEFVPRNPERLAAALELLKSAKPALSERRSKQLLALYGVPIAHERIAVTADEAVLAARTIGYPLVLKIHSADIPHKTEACALRLGIKNEAELRKAFGEVTSSAAAFNPEAELEGVLLAPMAKPGVELVVGAYQDAQFGPVVLAGLGGIFVEVLRDTALRLAPVDAAQAGAMLGELRGRALLDGVRGQPPADRKAVAQVIAALSNMMFELRDWISEVDINPLIVHAEGHGATVADALVVKVSEGSQDTESASGSHGPGGRSRHG